MPRCEEPRDLLKSANWGKVATVSDDALSYLLPRKGGRRFPPNLSHPPLPDVDLFLGVEDRGLGVRWEVSIAVSTGRIYACAWTLMLTWHDQKSEQGNGDGYNPVNDEEPL